MPCQLFERRKNRCMRGEIARRVAEHRAGIGQAEREISHFGSPTMDLGSLIRVAQISPTCLAADQNNANTYFNRLRRVGELMYVKVVNPKRGTVTQTEQ